MKAKKISMFRGYDSCEDLYDGLVSRFNGSESIVATTVYFSMLETMKKIEDKDNDE
jgi:hypothetical protein